MLLGNAKRCGLDSTPTPTNPSTRRILQEQRQQVKSALAANRISIPQRGGNTINRSDQAELQNFWLNAILDTVTIFLYYNETPEHTNDTRPTTNPMTWETTRNQGPSSSSSRCVAAAVHCVRLAKDILAVSFAPLQNPHLAPMLFICGHILIQHWARTKNDEVREEADMAVSILERLGETYPGLKAYVHAARREANFAENEGEGRTGRSLKALTKECSHFLFR